MRSNLIYRLNDLQVQSNLKKISLKKFLKRVNTTGGYALTIVYC